MKNSLAILYAVAATTTSFSSAYISSASSAFTRRGDPTFSYRNTANDSPTKLSMKLQTAIVGLPNVGKSTLFNALTETQGAEAANYPFCTVCPIGSFFDIIFVHDVSISNVCSFPF